MDADFKLIEREVEQEVLIIHNQKTKRTASKIDIHHPYFEKRIVWTLMKAETIQFYTEEELAEISKEFSQPSWIDVEYFEAVGTQTFIKEVLDRHYCFEFEYDPTINDIITLTEVYRFKSVNNIRRAERMSKCMTFLYQPFGWTSFAQDFRRSKIFKSGLLKT